MGAVLAGDRISQRKGEGETKDPGQDGQHTDLNLSDAVTSYALCSNRLQPSLTAGLPDPREISRKTSSRQNTDGYLDDRNNL